jgi:cell division septum initiation protein DivIVA
MDYDKLVAENERLNGEVADLREQLAAYRSAEADALSRYRRDDAISEAADLPERASVTSGLDESITEADEAEYRAAVARGREYSDQGDAR